MNMDAPGRFDNHYYNNGDFDNLDDGSEEHTFFVPSHEYYYFSLFILCYCSYCFYRSYRSNRTEGLLNESISISNLNTINKIKKNIIKFEDLTKENNECSICLDNFTNDKEIIILECKHVYHTDCIVQWLNKDISCPLCRESSLV